MHGARAGNRSTSADGPILVLMLQGLLRAGGRRLQQVSSIQCGDLSATEKRLHWTCVDSTAPKDIQINAGVYRTGERLVAVNRPPAEDEPEILEANEARRLFGNVSFQLWQERGGRGGRLQGEVWRLFLFAMLMFL